MKITHRRLTATALTLLFAIACILPAPVFAGGETSCLEMDKSNVDKVEWIKAPSAGFADPYSEDSTPSFGDDYNDQFDTESRGEYPNEKWGALDPSGKKVIDFKYDEAFYFFGKYAMVKLGGKAGMIDEKDNLVLKCEYDELYEYSEDLVAAKKDGKWGYVNLSGEWVIKPQYLGRLGYDYLEVTGFHHGVAVVTNEQLRPIIINKENKLAAPDIFSWGDIDNTGTGGDLIWYQDGILVKVTGVGYGIMKPISAAVPDAPETPALTMTATPTGSTVLVNGKNIAFDAYNIGGNNYFKLRDLALVLSGSEKQFEVRFDQTSNSISLESGKAYTAVGGELAGKAAGSKTATATSSTVLVNGEKVAFEAYNINGNNYFKLRNIGWVLDFGVTWDGSKNTIVINTAEGYTPE